MNYDKVVRGFGLFCLLFFAFVQVYGGVVTYFTTGFTQYQVVSDDMVRTVNGSTFVNPSVEVKEGVEVISESRYEELKSGGDTSVLAYGCVVALILFDEKMVYGVVDTFKRLVGGM